MVGTGSTRAGKWRQGTVERWLNELLSDEAARALMQADHVTDEEVRAALLSAVKRVKENKTDSTLVSRGGRRPARHPPA